MRINLLVTTVQTQLVGAASGFLAAALATGCDNANDDSASPEPVACEARMDQAECLDPSIPPPDHAWGVAECVWETEVLEFAASGGCEDAVVSGRCLTLPPGGNHGCVESPCPSLTVLFRETEEVVQILPGDYCGIVPEDFVDCVLDGAGELRFGPPQCECGCG